MEVILLKDIDKLGDRHELVSVKPGYGRNFLIPKGFALIANETNRKKLEDLKAKEEADRLARKAEFEAIAEKLKNVVIKIGAKSGTSGKIFGSVTNIQLAQALQEQQEIEVDRKLISIPEEVKTLGSYTAILDLHPEVQAQVAFEVVSE